MKTTNRLHQKLRILKQQLTYLKSSLCKSEVILEDVENNLITALDVLETASDDKTFEPDSMEVAFRGPAFNKRINLRSYREQYDEMES